MTQDPLAGAAACGVPASARDPARRARDASEALDEILEDIRHYLPAQGPIGVFVHHNTLHAFEHLPFEEAVEKAAELYGAEPFLPLSSYQRELARGRITPRALDGVLELEDPTGAEARLFGDRVTRRELQRYLLERLGPTPDEAALEFWLSETDVLSRFPQETPEGVRRALVLETTSWLSAQLEALEEPERLFEDPGWTDGAPRERRFTLPDVSRSGLARALREDPEACTLGSLWAAASARVHHATRLLPRPRGKHPERVRDVVLEKTGVDVDDEVHEILIPLVAAYLDQGLAYWPLPDRGEGLYEALRQSVLDRLVEPSPAGRLLRALAREDRARGRNASESLQASLEALGHPREAWARVLRATALALPGWAGLVAKLEREPELAPQECPPCSLLDFLAFRLLVERAVLTVTLRAELGERGALASWGASLPLAPNAPEPWERATVALLFQVARDLGIAAPALLQLSDAELDETLAVLVDFDELTRRRVLHLAYEREHRRAVLGGLATFRKGRDPARRRTPSAQLVFCIDDREESLRRHLEELEPSVETFATGGFFGVAVAYRGLDDGYHASLCPVVQKPSHAVREYAPPGQSAPVQRYLSRRKLVSSLLHGGYVGTRSLLRGWLSTFGLGVVSLLPLSMRVIHPRAMSRVSRRLARTFLPKPRTELALERQAEAEGSLALFPGFTTEEMADRVQRVLEDIGLVRGFARLVCVLGHGSSSLNNPLASAYDCGACGGRRGGPNARLFARMANDPGVRRLLAERGLRVPSSTVFVGGIHDTASDGVTWFDEDRVPATHRAEFRSLVELLDRARALDAHERSRRFESIPLSVSAPAALARVEGRAEDIAEPRPELGHAANAVCVFGRRGLTRGLFLDRRAFLVSYDPDLDADGEVLARLLAALGPVGAGINLEYYFSRVDEEHYGSGSKLPHNVVGLLGVMNGRQSDLRTGLPTQMVELHEPVRLVIVVESTPEHLARAAERHPAVARLVENRWIQLGLIDPKTGAVTEYENGRFVPVPEGPPLPEVERSSDWYFGKRDFLGLAKVRRGLEPAVESSEEAA